MEVNVIWILVTVVIIILGVVVVQGFQIADMNSKVTGLATGGSSGSVDMTGWTEDERMQYEHHGVLPSSLQSSSSGSGMVGGC